MAGPRYRLGVDVGGTHTDLVLNDTQDGSLRIEKLPSSPANPSLAVLEGVGRLLADGIDPAEIGFFAHGTTVTTNALLEGKGAKVGLLINAGYRAICEVQTQARDEGNPFDHLFRRAPHIAPPSMTREIPGRIDYAGAEIAALDEDAVRRAALSLAEAGARSFAVCFLFSFMNDVHERRAAALVREAVPGAQVSISSDVLPRIREWPRFSTTLVNACLVPVLARYIADLAAGLDGQGVVTRSRFLMQSNGGVMPLSADCESQTVHTLLSGPAGGVQGTAWLLGRQAGARNIVTLDMGGTSCDIAFVQDGRPLEHAETLIAGRVVGVPALDVSTISAGGGSLARITAAGLLQVGPDSAGADPGPACYGKGGALPAVTDADMVCGVLNPDYFLGGRMALDAAASRAAVETHVAKPLGMAVEDAAAGICRVVNALMADEIRVQSARKGIDLAGFTLVPFGGAGPVHAAAVARDLGIPRVLVPAMPGGFSALGLLCADVVHDYMRSELRPLAALAPARMEEAYAALEARARDELAAEGLGEAATMLIREADLRYAGQGYELRVPLDGMPVPVDAAGLAALETRFHDRHEAVHGHAARDAAVDVVSYRLRALVPMPKLSHGGGAVASGAAAAPYDRRRAVMADGAAVECNVWRRAALPVGEALPGPLIVEQVDATTVAPPGWTVRLLADGNLELTDDGAKR
jgi:N-methylhydantoinase A